MASILLCDDDDILLRAWTMCLVRDGHSVTAARSRQEAEAALRSRGSPIDVVILDLLLPDGTGIDILPDVRRFQPTASIIIASGYLDADIAVAMAGESIPIIPKPISLEALLRLIRSHPNPFNPLGFATEFHLTSRQAQVLACGIEGMSDKETALRLGCTEATIRAHWRRVFAKTGLSPRRKVIAAATGLAKSGS